MFDAGKSERKEEERSTYTSCVMKAWEACVCFLMCEELRGEIGCRFTLILIGVLVLFDCP